MAVAEVVGVMLRLDFRVEDARFLLDSLQQELHILLIPSTDMTGFDNCIRMQCRRSPFCGG
jgi:hypothetical protein